MIKKTYNYLKEKAIKFKKWIVILIFGAAVLAAPMVLPNVPDVALEKIQADYHASQIKNNYRLEKTAFILDAIDENAIQTEIGNKNSDEFLPELTLRKWSDEVNLKVKYRHNEKKKDLKFELDGKKIKLKGKKIETHFYEMENAYEFEIILLEKPNVNVVEFDIESKGLKFYYQPELTQKEKDEGAERPENVIGSYAVYHENKTDHILGQKNYMAGKAFHIYRPKIIDSAGTEVWGELNVTDDLLTVEIPQEFLDNAVYPVRHAAGLTFGYYNGGTPGGGSSAIGAYVRGSVFPSGGAGNTSKVSIYWAPSSAQEGRAAIYLHSDLSLIGGTTSIPVVSAGWYDHTLSVSIDNDNYVLVGWDDSWSQNMKYDTGDANQGHHDSQASPFENPANFSHGTQKYSIYCTYTAGGAARRMFLTQ